MFRSTILSAIFVTFVALSWSAPLQESDYIRQFRQDNPERTSWTDDDILDSYAEKYAEHLSEHPVLKAWTEKREREQQARLAAEKAQLEDDNKWDTRSILPWEKPPLEVSFTTKLTTWRGVSTVLPVVVISNTSKKPVAAVEALYKIDGQLFRRLAADSIAPGEALSIVFYDLFDRNRMAERKVRFICAGFSGSADVVVNFPEK